MLTGLRVAPRPEEQRSVDQLTPGPRFAPRPVEQRRSVDQLMLGLRVASRPAQQATEGQALRRARAGRIQASGVSHHAREATADSSGRR